MTEASVPSTSETYNPAPPTIAEPATQNYSRLPTVRVALGDKHLSQQQLLAIEAIAMGKNQTDTAQYAGVTRKTLYNWRHCDEDFRQELQRRQEMLWQVSIDRLRAMVPRAVATLKSDIEATYRPTRARAAAAVLRLANLRPFIAMKPQSG